jgi:hypothetical protein
MIGRIFHYFLIVCVLSGCVSPQSIPNQSILSSVETIEIIPIEPPPLAGVHSNYDVSSLATMSSLSMIPDTGFQNGARVATVLFAGWMLMQAATAGLESDENARLMDTLSFAGKWSPTIVLAEEARTKITSKSSRKINPIKFYYGLPVDDRGTTWHMENWYGPIRRWYAEDQSSLDYSQIVSGDVDVVLELGLLNYELSGGILLMQVMLKMIDPTTGNTLGRIRNGAYPQVASFNELMANDGKEFKETFSRIGQGLIDESLKEIGLLPE